ncbi:MAG: RagB/SusD family nutrient uptake outer membrane protein [Prevotella sp.]|nr:RagB/SusD family nutrient uptake outer membrane protein [Prevotella sp.]
MKKIIFGLAVAALALSSCSDLLDKEPVNKIGSREFFANADELELYANGLYVDMVPSAEDLTNDGSGTCDYLATSTTSSLLLKDFNVDKMSGWTYSAWKNLFRCNYFLENIPKAASTTDAATLNHYRGIARFWRAWFYYDKVKTYGNVPWYSHTIDAGDSLQLYKGRDDREVVMDSVLADLDFAAAHIKSDKSALVSSYDALALKSRVCLFEGTYRKYHAVNPSTNEPWKERNGSERWLRECVKASEALMNAGVYSLVNTGHPETDYRSLFQSETPNAQEVIMAREYSSSLNSTHNVTQKFNSAGNDTRRWSPTQAFVNTYLNRDGSRFTDAKDYDQKTFAENCTNRDCRLQQSVITPVYQKNINGKVQRYNANWAVTMTGYQVIKFNLDDTYYEQTSRCANAIPIFRYAEILLNEAEAKAELGEMDTKIWDKTIRPLRERAGVKGDAPATADPYLISYYRNKCTDKWLLEIRRERAIELFFEGDGLRYDDLMRWGEGEMLTDPWNSIYIGEKNVAYDTNGDGVKDLEVCDKKPSETESGVYYIVLSKAPYYTFRDGRLYIKNENDWSDKKYLHPIPRAALVKNPNLKQNYGWED